MEEITITPEHDGRRAFNASLCEFRGRMFMAYRVSYTDQPDRIWIAQLNRETLQPISAHLIEVPIREGWGAEDPRLFVHDDKLHVSWTGADYSKRPWCATMFYGAIEFAEGRVHVLTAYQPRYGFNEINQREKNWQFWSAGGCLFAQYAPSPHRVIQLVGDEVVGEWCGDGFEWPHGRPSGGTPPIPTSHGTLLTFFHSFVPHQTRDRLYSFAAMEFSAVAPFEILSVSPAPMLTAHEGWDGPGGKWQPLCVFPGGAVQHWHDFLVAAGVNDAGIRIFKISAEDMPLAAPIKVEAKPVKYFRALKSFLFDDRVRIVDEVIETDIESAQPLIDRNWLTPYENQTA